MGGVGQFAGFHQAFIRILTFSGKAFQFLRVRGEDRAFWQVCKCMAVVGEDIQCVGIQYDGSLAMFQLLDEGSFRFLVPSQARTDADGLIVIGVVGTAK